MRTLRPNALIVLISVLYCFSNLAIAGSLDPQERVLEEKTSPMDSKINAGDCAEQAGQGGSNIRRHGGNDDRECRKKWYCGHVDRDDRGHGRRCKGMKVRLCTSQRQIDWGESATLKWSCRRTESCELEPDIGQLDPNGAGTISVSPTETTQYTLIGKRSGCVVRSSVTIKVVNIPPPMTIVEPAEGASLTLGTTDTVAMVIEFRENAGIDIESFNALINNEDITDLFTVTDTGATANLSMRLPVGSNTLSVSISDNEGLRRTVTRHFKISYLPPTVSMSADPQTVKFGENTTLSWQGTNADNVIIEPGIGEVELNGSLAASIWENKNYTITATGPGGTATISVAVEVTDVPPAGIYYDYDELGRLRHLIRIQSKQSP